MSQDQEVGKELTNVDTSPEKVTNVIEVHEIFNETFSAETITDVPIKEDSATLSEAAITYALVGVTPSLELLENSSKTEGDKDSLAIDDSLCESVVEDSLSSEDSQVIGSFLPTIKDVLSDLKLSSESELFGDGAHFASINSSDKDERGHKKTEAIAEGEDKSQTESCCKRYLASVDIRKSGEGVDSGATPAKEILTEHSDLKQDMACDSYSEMDDSDFDMDYLLSESSEQSDIEPENSKRPLKGQGFKEEKETPDKERQVSKKSIPDDCYSISESLSQVSVQSLKIKKELPSPYSIEEEFGDTSTPKKLGFDKKDWSFGFDSDVDNTASDKSDAADGDSDLDDRNPVRETRSKSYKGRRSLENSFTDSEKQKPSYIDPFRFSDDSDDTDTDKDYIPDECSDHSDYSFNSDVEENSTRKQKSGYSSRNVLFPFKPKRKKQHYKEEGIRIQTCDNIPGRRIFNKRYFCAFCGNPYAKISRHWYTSHADERSIINLMNCRNKKMREIMMTKYRNLGNHLHNVQVIKEGWGELSVVYRPNNQFATYKDYVPCLHCLGYYMKAELWRHIQRCPLNTKPEESRKWVNEGRLLLPPSKKCSSELRDILIAMHDDEIGQIAESDDLIIRFGEQMATKHAHDSSRHAMIRNAMRELARFLRLCRESKKYRHLSDYLVPEKYEFLMSKARELAGFCIKSSTYEKPSLALKIGHHLKKCARIKLGDAIVQGAKDEADKHRAFLELHELRWTTGVSSPALRTMYHNKKNVITILPLTDDIVALTRYLQKEIHEATQSLHCNPKDTNSYAKLSQALLVSVILFNRRRQGEVSKMTLTDYNGVHSATDVVSYSDMSQFEHKLCENLQRIEIIGKCGRIVPIILTQRLSDAMRLLIKNRDLHVHNPNNTYVFAALRSGSKSYFRGCDLLRIYSVRCGAKRPEALRSTKLRKHIATMSQLLNLKDNELDILANYLGHDIRVHREYYRLPQQTVQLAKVSRLLIAMETGEVKKFQGKSLNEIKVNMDEELQIENEDEEDVDDDEEAHDGVERQNKLKAQKSEAPKDSQKRKRRYSSDTGSIKSSKTNSADLKEEDDDLPVYAKRHTRVKWSAEEAKVVLLRFKEEISLRKLPGKRRIEQVVAANECLKRRDWKSIKYYIKNYLHKVKVEYKPG